MAGPGLGSYEVEIFFTVSCVAVILKTCHTRSGRTNILEFFGQGFTAIYKIALEYTHFSGVGQRQFPSYCDRITFIIGCVVCLYITRRLSKET